MRERAAPTPRRTALFVGLAVACLVCGCTEARRALLLDSGDEVIARPATVVFHIGDERAWSAPDLPEDGWRASRPLEEPLWWARARVTLPALEHGRRPGLQIELSGAYEVYWDGEPIGTSGRVGRTPQEEVPGALRSILALAPDRASAGEHTIAIRASSHHDWRLGNFWLQVVDADGVRARWRTTAALYYLFVGVFLLVGTLLCALYLTAFRELGNLLFGVLTLLVGTLLALEYSRFVLEYPYSWHVPRLRAISINTAAVAFLVPVFVAEHLGLLRRRWRLALGLVPLVFLFERAFDPQCLHMLITSLGMAQVVSLAGIARRRHGSATLAAGIAVCLVPSLWTGWQFADRWFFLGYVATTLVFLAQVLRRIALDQRERQEAERRLVVLRYELLRKTIQPHFLMNALAASMSYLGEALHRLAGRDVLVVGDLEQQLAVVVDAIDPAQGLGFVVADGEQLDRRRRHRRRLPRAGPPSRPDRADALDHDLASAKSSFPWTFSSCASGGRRPRRSG